MNLVKSCEKPVRTVDAAPPPKRKVQLSVGLVGFDFDRSGSQDTIREAALKAFEDLGVKRYNLLLLLLLITDIVLIFNLVIAAGAEVACLSFFVTSF
jgi:hypothetical protein